jgi:glycosyltransferase involved in cell wall biosynthesis
MIALSIIVPVFNKVKYIDDCINSILNQTFADFELILINDGSTDGSDERCGIYAKLDKRIRFIDQDNMGVSAARNKGILVATGKYIGFVDADDSIEPDMYQLLLNNALANEADISGCGISISPSRHKKKQVPDAIGVYNHTEALCSNLKGDFERNVTNKIFRKEIVKACRFEGQIYEDILYLCKAYIAAGTSVFTSAQKYNYLIRDNSVSMNKFNDKYLETTAVSEKIVELVAKTDKYCFPQAQVFDVMANLSLLNLLLLNKEPQYASHYNRVVQKLGRYGSFIQNSGLVRKKHKYAWLLFTLSPALYRVCMYWYCLITNSDVIHRT